MTGWHVPAGTAGKNKAQTTHPSIPQRACHRSVAWGRSFCCQLTCTPSSPGPFSNAARTRPWRVERRSPCLLRARRSGGSWQPFCHPTQSAAAAVTTSAASLLLFLLAQPGVSVTDINEETWSHLAEVAGGLESLMRILGEAQVGQSAMHAARTGVAAATAAGVVDHYGQGVVR